MWPDVSCSGFCDRRAWLPRTMMMDHQAFSAVGLPAVSLGCLAGKMRHIHSRGDHPGLIQFEALRETTELLGHLIEELDKRVGSMHIAWGQRTRPLATLR